MPTKNDVFSEIIVSPTPQSPKYVSATNFYASTYHREAFIELGM